ncbi:MAG: fused MFS/spermidine synthase [Anaerolineaceae bacterium]|nr:fused MFS/spermidine synthase [Anaerolineaceae bacterium]MCB9098286.1 fused MFS/spermidine synthase [Anaerolineales bacterium]
MQPTITTDRLQPFWAIVIVFLSNFCILVIELIAGRMMAPIVGVSLYTWTSIIGVVLAGISLGNYLGGKIADRWASRNVLALFFALSALGSMTILASLAWVGALQALDLPIIASVVLIFTAVFLLPATILGTISPIVVKLTLNDLSQTGDIVGKIYAAGALGSIAGTFATGFFLISTFGTRHIVWGVAGTLLLIGLIISLSRPGRRRYTYLGLFLAFLALSGLAWQQGWLNSQCLRETNYFCIKVRLDDENEDLRILTLDRLVHSYVDLTDPTHLRYGYEQIYANVLATVFPDQMPVSVLFIGGGGYTFPHYIEVVHPGSQIEVIEIDPGVTAVAHDQLGLPLDTTITTFNEDARHFITNLPPTTHYDLIVGDAFNDFSVPYHLTTLEFNRLIATHLKPDGVYMVNIIDGKQGDFLRAYVNTLQQTFSHVYVAATVGELGTVSRQTYVVLATQGSLDTIISTASLVQTFVPEAEVTAYLQASPPILLTDDYVPVDNLLAPVFADSGL